jgi:hypothetical protein
MPRIQFSLRTLLLVFIPVALAFAALINANYIWANAVLSVTIACLGISLIACIWTSQKSRAFWSGFAIFGCGYMLLTFAPWLDEHIGVSLISQQLLEKSARLFGHEVEASNEAFLSRRNFSRYWENKIYVVLKDASTGKEVSSRMVLYFWDYMLIGHCLFTLLSGLLGGLIGRWFYSRHKIQASKTETGQSP